VFEPKPAKTVVVDEGVSDDNVTRFKNFAAGRGLKLADCLYIRQLHTGMPDGHILRHLLNSTTILITADRPLHNTALSKGFESYYLGKKEIVGAALHGILLKKEVVNNTVDQSLHTSYLPAQTEISSLLLPNSPQQLKKLRTKRRRIRGYFDGLHHMSQVAVTVSWQAFGQRTLIGVQIQVSSNAGLKTLDASESYTAESLTSECRGIGSLSYSLVLVLQLMLNSVATVVYFDSARIYSNVTADTNRDNKMYQIFFKRLSESFTQLEFVPVSKGRHIEALRSKLTQLLNCHTTNEIQQENLGEILCRFAEHGEMLTPSAMLGEEMTA
jgi:hypothetical protein